MSAESLKTPDVEVNILQLHIALALLSRGSAFVTAKNTEVKTAVAQRPSAMTHAESATAETFRRYPNTSERVSRSELSSAKTSRSKSWHRPQCGTTSIGRKNDKKGRRTEGHGKDNATVTKNFPGHCVVCKTWDHRKSDCWWNESSQSGTDTAPPPNHNI